MNFGKLSVAAHRLVINEDLGNLPYRLANKGSVWIGRVSAGLQMILPFGPVPAVAGLQHTCNTRKICGLIKQLLNQIFHQRASALDM